MRWVLTDKEKFKMMSADITDGSFTEPGTRVKSMLARFDTCCVGDFTTRKYREYCRLGVIDGVTRRERFAELAAGPGADLDHISAENPAGEVSDSLFKAVAEACERDFTRIIRVEGEEDLAVLPIMLLSPRSTGWILWGDPERECTEYSFICPENRMKVLEIMAACGRWEA